MSYIQNLIPKPTQTLQHCAVYNCEGDVKYSLVVSDALLVDGRGQFQQTRHGIAFSQRIHSHSPRRNCPLSSWRLKSKINVWDRGNVIVGISAEWAVLSTKYSTLGKNSKKLHHPHQRPRVPLAVLEQRLPYRFSLALRDLL